MGGCHRDTPLLVGVAQENIAAIKDSLPAKNREWAMNATEEGHQRERKI